VYWRFGQILPKTPDASAWFGALTRKMLNSHSFCVKLLNRRYARRFVKKRPKRLIARQQLGCLIFDKTLIFHLLEIKYDLRKKPPSAARLCRLATITQHRPEAARPVSRADSRHHATA
jgi:hypothetical protein